MNEPISSQSLRDALTSVSIGRRYSIDSNQRTSFLDILEEIDKEAAAKLTGDLDRFEELERLGHTPILGVCGMQNSGKSTLVAHHLSAEGRDRVLVGEFSDEGTHRFVFWAPQSWGDDPERKTALERFIGKAFDGVPEMLATNPQKAAEQYNARTARTEEFGVPLLAFDPALDDLGLAILDCPDIQRSLKPEAKERTAHLRKEALAKAARLCSCFFIVSEVTQQEDEKLNSVFDAIEAEQTGLPIYYICTKASMSRPDSVRADVVHRLESARVWEKVNRIFASPRLAEVPENGYPEKVEYHDLDGELKDIADVSRDLDASQLQRQFLDDLVGKVFSHFQTGKRAVLAHQENNQKIIREARAILAKFLDNEFHKGKGGMSPLYTRQVVSALMDSMARTAPWYLQPSMWVAGGFRWMKEGLCEGWGWIEAKLPSFRQARQSQTEAIKDLGKVSPDSFVLCLHGSWFIPAEVDDELLKEVWKRSLAVLAKDDWVNHSELRIDLDKRMEKVWDEISTWDKVLATTSLPVMLAGGLAVVLLAPIDFGGSAVIYSASLSEIFFAIGLSGAAASHALDNSMEIHAARPQHSALLAMLQDRIGVPRATEPELLRMTENKKMKLHVSSVPRKDPLIHVLKEPVILLDEVALESVEQALKTKTE